MENLLGLLLLIKLIKLAYPKVSVIIPTYNYSKYIAEALNSINNQTYPSEQIEIIIVDDGSADDTASVIEKYNSKIPIFYHFQSNKGKASATQKGIELASGEILFNLDADDFFKENKIAEIVKIFNENPSVVHVGHPASIYFEAENRFETESISPKICGQTVNGQVLLLYFLQSRTLFGGGSTYASRSSVFIKNVIPDGIDMFVDEYLIFYSLSHGDSYLLNQNLSVWRVHNSNYSVSKDVNYEKKQIRLLKSSSAMNTYIASNNEFSGKLKDIYFIKHLDRIYGFKNELAAKTFKDMVTLFGIIFSFKYSFATLHNYRIFYKFLPVKILNGIKTTLNKFKLTVLLF